jgi:CRP/FNR family transcriptional regulator, anaerobic regulatory protein
VVALGITISQPVKTFCHLYLLMLQQLLQVISPNAQLDDADVDLCQKSFEQMSFGKNAVLEQEGKVPRYLYFIVSGFMRLYYVDDQGNEVTTNICQPNSFITSFLSFIHEKKAIENVGCITNCDVLRISRKALVALIGLSDQFKKFSTVIFEQAMASAETRANGLATLTAEQRYKKLMENQPAILQNVPAQYVASLLGIKPESLSRIRRQIIN